jgi:hypothetical protein
LAAGGHVVHDAAAFKAVAGDDGALDLAIKFETGAVGEELTTVDGGGRAVFKPKNNAIY